MASIHEIRPDQARHFMLEHLGLDRAESESGTEGARRVLNRLNCVQIDPLDPMGTNPDCVFSARVDGLRRGQWMELYGATAFEHYAKERCLIPAKSFPQYRDNHIQTRWWRHRERQEKLQPEIVEQVYAEIEARGPVRTQDLTHLGNVDPLDWHGWKGTKSLTVLAVELLWITGRVVVAQRSKRDKYFDLPQRAMPESWQQPSEDYEAWALLDRVHACGLLAELSGPTWSTIDGLRKSAIVENLVEQGALHRIRIAGDKRTYLALPTIWEHRHTSADNRMRILGPLDPLLWDRKLVDLLFEFDYIWEVYKPPAKRRWGWYVQPLLYRGQLVGRLEGKVNGRVLNIENLWIESNLFNENALDAALERHTEFCGCDSYEIANRIDQRD